MTEATDTEIRLGTVRQIFQLYITANKELLRERPGSYYIQGKLEAFESALETIKNIEGCDDK